MIGSGTCGQPVTCGQRTPLQGRNARSKASPSYADDVADPSTDDAISTPRHGSRIAAFFDLDKTVIASSSALAFSRPLQREGLINRRAALKGAYAQLMFSLAGADALQTERLRTRISALCTGWDVAQVSAIVNETLHDIVDPLVYAEAAELIAGHKGEQHDVIVLSATGDEVVAPIAALLGADEHVATRMQIRDGRYSGEVEFYCYGEEKANAARRLAEVHGYDLTQCYAYTDSSTDLPLLESVGRPCAVNPDRALRKVAEERDWPVLSFSRPVSLRSKMPSGTTTAVALGVGVGAVAAAGVTWYAMNQRNKRNLEGHNPQTGA